MLEVPKYTLNIKFSIVSLKRKKNKPNCSEFVKMLLLFYYNMYIVL